jgi:hypothetical protein
MIRVRRLSGSVARGRDFKHDDLLDLPGTLAEWLRNSRETVRVRFDHYSGQVVVDCRSWWRDADGELQPGKGGLTLSCVICPPWRLP